MTGSGPTPTGTIHFVVGTESETPVTLVGGQATLTLQKPSGSYMVTAYYSGDSFYQKSVAKLAVQVIRLAPVDTLDVSPSPASLGSTVTATFTVPTTGGVVPTGTVKLTGLSATPVTVSLVDGVATYQTSSLGIGTHGVTAQYSGDAYYAGSRLTSSVLVGKASSNVSLSSSGSPANHGTTVSFTGSVAESLAGVVPTGRVQFYLDTVLVATKTLVSGQAIYSKSFLTAGNHYLYVVYSGDGHYAGSTSTTIVQNIQ